MPVSAPSLNACARNRRAKMRDQILRPALLSAMPSQPADFSRLKRGLNVTVGQSSDLTPPADEAEQENEDVIDGSLPSALSFADVERPTTGSPVQAPKPGGHQYDGIDTPGASLRTRSRVHSAQRSFVMKTTVKRPSGNNNISAAPPAPTDSIAQVKEGPTVSRATALPEKGNKIAPVRARFIYFRRRRKKTAATKPPEVPRPDISRYRLPSLPLSRSALRLPPALSLRGTPVFSSGEPR